MTAAEGSAIAPPATPTLAAALEAATAWPFVEARKLVARVGRTGQPVINEELGIKLADGCVRCGTYAWTT